MDAGYLLQEGLALKEEARGLGRYLIEDFAQYGAHRKREGRQTLLIIDEYSAIAHGAADVANLFERVCSFDAAVIVSSQSYAGLGTDAERILDAVGSVVLHACADPERLSRRAGIEPDRTKTIQVERTTSNRYSLHAVETPKVDPNAVRHLEVGECFVIAGGQAARVSVAQVPLSEQPHATSQPREQVAGPNVVPWHARRPRATTITPALTSEPTTRLRRSHQPSSSSPFWLSSRRATAKPTTPDEQYENGGRGRPSLQQRAIL